MEHVGTGIAMMRKTMEEHGLPEPEFIDENNFFKVVIYAPNNKLITPKINTRKHENNNKFNALNDRQKSFLQKYDKNQPITYKEYMNLFKISKSTARRDMNLLIEYDFVYTEKKDSELVLLFIVSYSTVL